LDGPSLAIEIVAIPLDVKPCGRDDQLGCRLHLTDLGLSDRPLQEADSRIDLQAATRMHVVAHGERRQGGWDLVGLQVPVVVAHIRKLASLDPREQMQQRVPDDESHTRARAVSLLRAAARAVSSGKHEWWRCCWCASFSWSFSPCGARPSPIARTSAPRSGARAKRI